MAVADERLRRLLGKPELAWLVHRVRTRLERGQPLDGTVTLNPASAAQRAAADQLLGRRAARGTSLSVPLSAVDCLLRSSGAAPDGLAAAVVALTGPVTVRAETATALDRAWREAYDPLDALIARRPEFAEWLAGLQASGLGRRLTASPPAAQPFFARLATVLDALPATGEALGSFAARVAGGAHALDDGQPLSTLTLGAACALSGHPRGRGARWRREAWASVGVLLDELSNTVLTLGLPGDARSATGQALTAWATAGQPVVLTLRQLTVDPPALGLRDRLVSVCENPVVVAAAADALGDNCNPVVCTSGQPGAATMRLLALLVERGAVLRYHGDFDWPGLGIANTLFARLPVTPWRFCADDYRTAASTGASLRGAPVEARWDSELAPAMGDIGVQVEEELVLTELLEDLRQ